MEQLSGLLVGRDGKSENRELACWVEVRERPTLYSERINQTRALRKGWGTLVIVRDEERGKVGHPSTLSIVRHGKTKTKGWATRPVAVILFR